MRSKFSRVAQWLVDNDALAFGAAVTLCRHPGIGYVGRHIVGSAMWLLIFLLIVRLARRVSNRVIYGHWGGDFFRHANLPPVHAAVWLLRGLFIGFILVAIDSSGPRAAMENPNLTFLRLGAGIGLAGAGLGFVLGHMARMCGFTATRASRATLVK